MQTQIFPCWSLEVLETIPLTISNWISIQKHNIDRAQANGEQPASIETENFDDAAVNWSRRDVTQNICFARQRNGAKSPITCVAFALRESWSRHSKIVLTKQ